MAALGRLSPLGLTLRGYGDFTKTSDPILKLGRYSPLGLTLRGYGSFSRAATSVEITGAQMSAEAGLVSASVITGLVAQFGPLGLSTKVRQFSSKETEADVSVSITGAEIRGQAEHPDSADATIYPGTAVIFGFANLGASAALFGSLADGVLESDLQADLEDAVIILTGATWVIDFNNVRQSIIDGFSSTDTESTGWNTQVRDKMSPVAVTRASDTQVHITFSGFSSYSIAADETIFVTVPNEAINITSDINVQPTFVVTANVPGGTEIENLAAEVVLSNYVMCDRSNWRVYPSGLKKEYTGMMVREDLHELRHPQEEVKSRGGDKEPGSPRPEGDDVFLDTPVSGDDL